MTAGRDAVIVGGGAAGIAAARRLHDAGRDVLILEAGNRLGGRASTVTIDGLALDLGCGWLHSARRNPWTDLATAHGLDVDRTAPRWGEQWRDLGFPKAEREAFDAAWEQWEERARAALDGPDRPLGDFIEADDPWRPLLDAMSGFINGAPLAAVSLHDWAAYEDAATDDNWRVHEGYGTLVARHAEGLPHRLNTLVTGIDHGGPTLRIATLAGTLETRAAILCLPSTAYDRLAFSPPLPAKQEAAAALPLGLADKAFLRIDGDDLPTGAHLLGDPHRERTASYQLRPLGLNVVEAFFGGSLAEELHAAGEGATSAFAIDELANLFGTDWRNRLTPLAASDWRAAPHIHGAYSHSMVGQAPARRALAEPVDDRLFFTGECCSPTDFSTAHGAYLTGFAAAGAVLQT